VIPGSVLAESVYSSQGGTRFALLQRGVALDTGMLAALERIGVFAVYVEDELSEGINAPRPIAEATRHETVTVLTDVFSTAKEGRTTKVPVGHVVQLESMVERVMEEVTESGEMISFLGDLGSFDSYTLNHSVNVCLLGLLIGETTLSEDGWIDFRGDRRTDGIEGRLEALGLGLLLHDIGKVVVPHDVLCKPSRLTDDEMQMIRNHPAAGATLVEGVSVSPLTRAVILGHHERWDGRGYPAGKAGEDIHPNARIASIADVYDAVSADRVYRTRRPSHEAYELILNSSGTAFDPDLVEVFRRVVAPYPVGTAVLLSSGQRGLVAQNHPQDGTRPTVRITHGAEGRRLAHAKDLNLVEQPAVIILDSMDDPGDDLALVSTQEHESHPEVLADHILGDAVPV
jgi:HD-GYP domain-containing protein (c-di-GMP phosphodiesterase class II)